jgi:decaprenylphospho-beta-D-erythro-pentofuranosid-2-ulose 2-reductase
VRAPQGVLVAHGWLPDQAKITGDVAALVEVLRVNGESACQWLAAAAGPLAVVSIAQGGGWLAAISSVAADRGRAKMAAYGAAKAMVSHYVSALGQALQPAGVRVLDIRPGPVATAMTAGLGPIPLMAQPEAVAIALVKACGVGKRGGNGVYYIPAVWWLVMTALQHVPGVIWRRMKF